MATLLVKRGTRAQLDAAALAGQLNVGEPYLITDESRIAIGTSATTYDETARLSEMAGIAQEGTQQELLSEMALLLSAILARLPRTDAALRQAVTIEAGSVGIAATQTLATLTTLQTLGAASRPADAMPLHLSNAGALHLYDRILVS